MDASEILFKKEFRYFGMPRPEPSKAGILWDSKDDQGAGNAAPSFSYSLNNGDDGNTF